jgi:hypothetical protein
MLGGYFVYYTTLCTVVMADFANYVQIKVIFDNDLRCLTFPVEFRYLTRNLQLQVN